jgi:hypothetical protein
LELLDFSHTERSSPLHEFITESPQKEALNQLKFSIDSYLKDGFDPELLGTFLYGEFTRVFDINSLAPQLQQKRNRATLESEFNGSDDDDDDDENWLEPSSENIGKASKPNKRPSLAASKSKHFYN